MSRVQRTINHYCQGLPLMERVYASALPYPYEIVQDLGRDGVALLFEEIATLSVKREQHETEGSMSGDETDAYWTAINQLASLIPYQIRLYPAEGIAGLAHENPTVRFYIACALSKTPVKQAVPALICALSNDNTELNQRVFNDALTACTSRLRCWQETLAKWRKTLVN